MTFEERVDALAMLGLTRRQTRFLVTVALHGGYCLRRQYATFAGVRYGKNVRQFLDGLVATGIASRSRFRADRGHVYHVHARAVYRAVGLEESRKSRPVSAALIARKLMLLDFVVGEPGVAWYVTEQDKVALFVQQFRVPEADLPQRVYDAERAEDGKMTRYFVHNLPIYVTPDGVVHLVYLAMDVTARGLEQFLVDHALLVRHLPQWAVVCLRPAHLGPLPGAEAAFARCVSPATTAANGSASLVRHFHVRRAIDEGHLSTVSVAELYAFRAAQRRLSTPAVEQQYREWLASGDQARVGQVPIPGVGAGRLLLRVLPFPYQQFGTMAGVA